MSINLMPWREARRKQLQKDFLTKIGLSALGAIGGVVIGGLITKAMIDGEHNRIQYLKTHISEAEKKIEEITTLEKKREQMLGRKNVIEKLQADRDQLPHLMYELAENVVDGVTVTSVNYKNNVLTIDGKATSNASVASYINNLEKSSWFKKPEIIIIENQQAIKDESKNPLSTPLSNQYTYNYVIRSEIINPNTPKSDDDASSDNKATENNRRRNRL